MANIVLIGAGSLQFGLGAIGDICATSALEGSTITLLDINDKALQVVYKQSQDFIKEHSLSYQVKATTNRKEALQGAEFIIISIEIGDRFKLWDQDRTIPQQYGIRQVYGENGGPGGLFHALRIVPPILDICEDVVKICPDAFVFNYSNPMSRICTTVHKKYPQLKFIGLCHEIASLERYLPVMLGIDFKDLDLIAGGLNHLSVLLKATNKKTGKNIYPEIKEKARSFFAMVPTYTDYIEYYEKHGEYIDVEGSRMMTELKTKKAWGERALFKFILDTFDLLPITSDSHLGEYLSWAYDVVDHKGILDFYRYYQQHLQQAEHTIKLKIKERIAVIIEGIVTDSGYTEEAVNIPNKGFQGKFIEELPADIVVEVPAVINKKGVHGISLGALPIAYAGILQNQIAIHNMNAEAILTKSKQAVIQALLVDSVNTTAIRLDEMVDLMIESQQEYLGYLK